MNTRTSVADIKAIILARKSGLSQKVIAYNFGRNISTICSILRRHGLYGWVYTAPKPKPSRDAAAGMLALPA